MDAKEKQINELIKTPEVVKKMTDYVRLNGFEPHSNPLVLAGQCCLIREGNIKKFAEDVRQYFATPADYNRYVTSSEFAFDAPHGADELEAKMGWYGFDDEETHHIIPLIAGAGVMAAKGVGKLLAKKGAKEAVKKGGGILGKIFKKKQAATTEQPVGALVQRAGKKVKQLAKIKKKQQKQLEEAQAKADYLNAQVSALQAGVPASQVQGQSLETIKLAEKITSPDNTGIAGPIANTDVAQLGNKNMLIFAGIGLVVLLLMFRGR